MFTGVFKASSAKPLSPFLARERLALLLNHKALRNLRFTPQGRVGPFVVDYVCREAGLIIDLVHARGPVHPESRGTFLAQMGYRVLRVTSGDLADPRKLLRMILAAIEG